MLCGSAPRRRPGTSPCPGPNGTPAQEGRTSQALPPPASCASLFFSCRKGDVCAALTRRAGLTRCTRLLLVAITNRTASISCLDAAPPGPEGTEPARDAPGRRAPALAAVRRGAGPRGGAAATSSPRAQHRPRPGRPPPPWSRTGTRRSGVSASRWPPSRPTSPNEPAASWRRRSASTPRRGSAVSGGGRGAGREGGGEVGAGGAARALPQQLRRAAPAPCGAARGACWEGEFSGGGTVGSGSGGRAAAFLWEYGTRGRVARMRGARSAERPKNSYKYVGEAQVAAG